MREFGEASIESKKITNKLERVCDIQTGVNKIWKRNVILFQARLDLSLRPREAQ